MTELFTSLQLSWQVPQSLMYPPGLALFGPKLLWPSLFELNTLDIWHHMLLDITESCTMLAQVVP